MNADVVQMNIYLGFYYFFLKYGVWYLLGFILAVLVYFHAWFRSVEPALAWAFLSFALPVIGAGFYVIYYLCSWKNLCVSRKEKEYAKEVMEKWEKDSPTSGRERAEKDFDSSEKGLRP